MTQQAKGRIGLLLGLTMIIAFGIVLSEVQPEISSRQGSEPSTFEPTAGTIYSGDAEFLTQPSGNDRLDIDDIPLVDSSSEEDVSRREDEDEQFADRVSLETFEEDVSAEEDTIVEEVVERPQPQFATYRVKRGDRLITIAKKHYGAGKAMMYKKILRADGSPIDDPSRLAVGEILRLPALSSERVERRPQPIRQVARIENVEVTAEPVRSDVPDFSTRSRRVTRRVVAMEDLRQTIRDRNHRAAGSHRKTVYVVKKGDNLTAIAKETLGTGSRAAVNRLFRANKDRLRNVNNLPTGITLRIPG